MDEIEGAVKAFKPATYDVGRQLKAIEAFEAQAVRNAQETKGLVDRELADLEKTLKNISEARPFEDLTVVRFGFLRRGCSVWRSGRNADLLLFRMRSLRLSRISTLALHS